MGKKVGSLLTGAAVGLGLGLLFAPKKGEETRKDLKEKIDDLVNKSKDLDMDDVKKYIADKTSDIEKAIKSLNAEKVKKEAKKQAKVIQEKAEDLVAYVKEKGTPVLEASAKKVREKAIEATKVVLDKLEEK